MQIGKQILCLRREQVNDRHEYNDCRQHTCDFEKQNRKQTDLAKAIGTSKQTVNKMLNGTRMINTAELKSISDFLGVKMEDQKLICALIFIGTRLAPMALKMA